MPMPATISLAEGKLVIDGTFSVRVSGYSNPQLDDAVTQFTARVSRQTGIPITGGEHAVLTVECRSAAPDYPALGEDESYQLEITSDGARLSAPSVTGVLRGLQTFSQLITPDARSFFVPALHIEDRPRFPWRGLMLDVSRHWMPMSVVLRNLDAMAAVSSTSSIGICQTTKASASRATFPKLQQLGSDGIFYTQAEVRRVVDYARNLGIRVVPEFDIPGHTTCWLVGYPRARQRAGAISHRTQIWGLRAYFGPIDPVNPRMNFWTHFIGEMAALFSRSVLSHWRR